MTAMSRGSPSSAVCRARSFMTTPGLRWPASSVTASVSGHVCSASYDPHYLFEDRFGRPGKGNDKGKVEGIVGYCRRNFLVPMPRFRNFDDLNTHLEACCAKRWAEQLRGHDQTVGERLERDRAVLQRLPAIAYDACDKRPGRVSSLSLVAIAAPIYSSPHGSAIARCWSAAMSTRWSSVAPQR